MNGLASRLPADWRALRAAARKEWQLVRRQPFEFVSVIFWPLILPPFYLLQAEAFGARHEQTAAAFAARAGTDDLALFLYVGWAVSAWLSLVLYGPGLAMRREQLQGALETNFLSPASRVVLLLGPAPAYLVRALWMFSVVGLTIRFGLGVPIGPAAAARAVLVIVLSVPVLVGIGALFAAATMRFRDASALVQALRGVFLVFCGITYPVVVLPSWGQAIAAALPPTHVLANLRAALVGVADLAEFGGTLLLIAAAGVGLFGLAVAALRASEQHALRTGSLGQH